MQTSISVAEIVPVVLLALLGLAVGSFLNVVIARVPAGDSVVSPRSRCPSCGAEIAGRDNIPVLSWLLLRARCRHCGRSISARYPIVELGTSALWLLMLAHFGWASELPAYLYLMSVGLALAVIDIDTKRLPDALTLPSYPVLGLLLLLPAIVGEDLSSYVRAWLAALGLFAFYFLLAVIYPAGMGFGDVKLSGVLGLALGWLGWGVLAVGGFLGFLLGSVIGLLLMALSRAGRKTKIPFGRFMLAGTLLAILWGDQVWDGYLSALT